MSGYLLDTNVISELLKKRPNPRVVERVRAVRMEELATSVVCAMELRYGAGRHPRGTMLWARISREVLPLMRMLPFGLEDAVRSGNLLAELEGRGEPVATRNVRHFSRIQELPVES